MDVVLGKMKCRTCGRDARWMIFARKNTDRTDYACGPHRAALMARFRHETGSGVAVAEEIRSTTTDLLR